MAMAAAPGIGCMLMGMPKGAVRILTLESRSYGSDRMPEAPKADPLQPITGQVSRNRTVIRVHPESLCRIAQLTQHDPDRCPTEECEGNV